MTEITFNQALNGKFEGILRWQQLDAFWPNVKQTHSIWYFYQVGSPVPETPLNSDEFALSLTELDTLLRKEHDYDYCGVVYADDVETPSLIKVYDPNNLGSSCGCGCGGNRIPARWIISQQKPKEIMDDAPTPNNRKRWWNQLFRLG